MKKKFMISILLLVAMFALAACGGSDDKKDDAKTDETETETETEQEVVTEDELLPEDELVAVVNDTDLFGENYNIVYSQLKMQLTQLGQEVEADELKEIALESLIDREILMQEATELGIDISEEKTKEELDKMKEENQEGLDRVLEQLKMTEDQFQEQLKFEMALVEFQEEVIDVEITDEEVEEYYEKAKEGNDDIPELEDIKDQIKSQMEDQKVSEAIQDKIDKVRESATIEKKMEA